MNTTTQTDEPQQVTCEYENCVATGERWEFFNGEYCGSDCYHRAKGADVLAIIADDHRFCGSCFGVIRDIVTPPEGWVQDKASRIRAALDDGAKYVSGPDGTPVLDASGCTRNSRPVAADAVIGLQSPTDRTEIVTDEQPVDDNRQWHCQSRGRWGCQCGAIDHRDRDPTLQRSEGYPTVVSQLFWALHVLYVEGQVPESPNSQHVYDTLNNEGADFELAVGRALYD